MATESEPAGNGKIERLALMVATGSTIKAAAEFLGVAESTAYHLSRTNEFKQRLAEIQNIAVREAVAKLCTVSTKAVQVLEELLGSNEPQIRLSAAKSVLTLLIPLSESADLRDQVAAIEAQLAAERKQSNAIA